MAKHTEAQAHIHLLYRRRRLLSSSSSSLFCIFFSHAFLFQTLWKHDRTFAIRKQRALNSKITEMELMMAVAVANDCGLYHFCLLMSRSKTSKKRDERKKKEKNISRCSFLLRKSSFCVVNIDWLTEGAKDGYGGGRRRQSTEWRILNVQH